MKKFEITEEQIKNNANKTFKEYFLEVFSVDFFELNKWYKDELNKWLFCFQGDGSAYGFINTTFGNNYSMMSTLGFRPATEQEVFEALKNEAIKRGFVKGVYVNNTGINDFRDTPFKEPINGEFVFYEKINVLDSENGDGEIFKNGKWAEIIKTYTKSEAEQLLNAKII